MLNEDRLVNRELSVWHWNWQIHVRGLLRNEEQANKQGVCCFQADYALRLTVLHPSDTSVLT